MSTNGCGVLTQDGGVLTQDGGVLTQDGGVLTQDGGVLTQDGGVLTQDGGVLSPLSPYPLPSEAKAKQADVRLNTIICCAFLRVHIFPKKQKMNLFLPFLAQKS